MDTIAEFLTRIRNASQAKHEKVDVPSSNMRKGIATILQDAGFIRSFKVAQDSKQGIMRIYLKYNANGESSIDKLQMVSTPGKRRYIGANEIPQVRSGMGVAIVSTSKGVLSGEQAKAQNVGGELLCKVW